MDPEGAEDHIIEEEAEEEILADNGEVEIDEEAEAKEKERMKELKKSKSSFMKGLAKPPVKEKKQKGHEEQMKELINQAEKYASFLLSKHKMHNRG